MFPKQLVIIGGGASINDGIKLGLFDLIPNIFSCGLNYAYKYINTTVNSGVDETFWNANYKELVNLPLYIGKEQVSLQNHNAKNAYFFPPNRKYDRDLIGGVYKSTLAGLFALSLFIKFMDEGEIYLCYDDKTEIFTNEGWKLFKNLTGQEKVLTRKIDGQTEWSNIIAKQKYKYDGRMKKIKSKGINLVVTPNHPFYLIPNKKYNYSVESNGYIYKEIKDFTTANHKIPKIFDWKGNFIKFFNVPVIEKNKYDSNSYPLPPIEMNNWVRFLGLYLSEGCIATYGGDYKIIIYQNHTKEKDLFIKSILDNLPIHYIWHKRGWYIYNKQLVLYLKQFGNCYSKYIPKEILNLDKKFLQLLLNSLLFGDGCQGKKQSFYYYTSSKQLADDVQELAYKCGYNAEIYWRKGRKCLLSQTSNISLPQWTVYLNKCKSQGNINTISTKGLVVKKNINDIYYKGYVYDITAEKNHVIWVRRNNIAVWSGNCGYDYGPQRDSYGKPLIDERGRILTHWYQGKCEHRGIGKINWYTATMTDSKDKKTRITNAENEFRVFANESKVKIYNVGLQSAIPTFEKISYESFFSKILITEHNQNEIREELIKKCEHLQYQFALEKSLKNTKTLTNIENKRKPFTC